MQLSYYAENFNALERTCLERGTAIQTIKSIAMRPWKEREHTRATWYQPLEAQDEVDTAVWWVLGNPSVFLNSVGDVNLLPKVLDAASRYEKRPDEAAMEQLVRRSAAEPLFV
jgi:hypothetical protein